MQFKQTLLALAIGVTAMSAHAATLKNGDILTIAAGTGTATSSSFTPTGGSFFAMLGAGGALIPGSGTSGGIVIGATTTPGQIDQAWSFAGNPGLDFAATPITGGTTTGLNFSGWTVYYGGGNINMGSNAWTTPTKSFDYVTNGNTFTNGVANFSWDGVYGHTYTLTYHAAVPSNSPAYANIKYDLNLTGTVVAAPVPEASTYGMMVVGLGLVGAAVMRRRKV